MLEDRITPRPPKFPMILLMLALNCLILFLLSISLHKQSTVEFSFLLKIFLLTLALSFIMLMQDYKRCAGLLGVLVTDYARLRVRLATYYRNRTVSYLGNNLEEIISIYESSSKILSRKYFPEDWALLQGLLCQAYCDKLCGNMAENMEKAISTCEGALQVLTRKSFPEDWALLQSKLGRAYQERIYGDIAENKEKAISAYKSALEIITKEAFREDWIVLQIKLARAYQERIYGDRDKNLKQALISCNKTLNFFPRVMNRTARTSIFFMLGSIYLRNTQDNHSENIEQAITCLQKALKEYQVGHPKDIQILSQVYLGRAYSQRLYGKRSDNLEDAIISYNNALKICENHLYYVIIKTHMCCVYRQRFHGVRAANLNKAIKAGNTALHLLKREEFPYHWAQIKRNLSLAYHDLGQVEQAILCLRSALEVYTPKTFPIDCFQIARQLGEIAFTVGRWSDAIEGYSAAINAVETSRTWAKTDTRRQKIIKEAVDTYEKMVQACINNGQLEDAIETVERSRSKHLVDLMASNDLYKGSEISPQVLKYLQDIEELQQKIDQERYINSLESNPLENSKFNRVKIQEKKETIINLEADKQSIWEELRCLDPVLAGQIQVDSPTFTTMQKLIEQRNTAIISFYTIRNNTHIFILKQDEINCHTCTGQGWEELEPWILDNWLVPYVNNKTKASWRQQISTFLAQLAQRLRLNELIANYLSDVEELILVPHLFLHQIPFAAIPIGDDQTLVDKFHIRYVPSCQVLEFCQKRLPIEMILESSLKYGIVEDATEDLPCASFEGERIAQLHNIPEHQRLKGHNQATVSNYLKLAKEVQVLHSCHHAQSRIDNPLESRLVLADGSLTLGQLLTPSCRLPHISDVFLSCCESGLGLTEATDDILTLSTGFLCAGARSVVSTLWSVEDLSTSLFSIFYYEYRQNNLSRPVALQQAQFDLRSLTGETFSRVYKPQLEPLLKQKFKQAETARKEAKKQRNNYPENSQAYQQWEKKYEKYAKMASRIWGLRKNLEKYSQDDFPFKDPFFWAAFTCSGLA